jgi:hypothetical protein
MAEITPKNMRLFSHENCMDEIVTTEDRWLGNSDRIFKTPNVTDTFLGNLAGAKAPQQQVSSVKHGSKAEQVKSRIS